MTGTVLILGSGPNAVEAREIDKSWISALVTINNAWAVRDDWDYLVYPDDFPPDRLPAACHEAQTLIDETDFVPAQNQYGGFVYAGGTMAYTTAYWALHYFQPRQILFLGCDMHYPSKGPTHFYGTGTPDPLRNDITLTSLEASSARFFCLAYQQGCVSYNLSRSASRLLFPRAEFDSSGILHTQPHTEPDRDKLLQALRYEDELGYMVENGRYWESDIPFDRDALIALDRQWLAASPFDFRLA